MSIVRRYRWLVVAVGVALVALAGAVRLGLLPENLGGMAALNVAGSTSFTLGSAPVAISLQDRVHVFAKGAKDDEYLYHLVESGKDEGRWRRVGCCLPAGSAPAVVPYILPRPSPEPDLYGVMIFVRGRDNQMWWKTWFPDNQDMSFSPLGGQFTADPTAVLTQRGSVAINYTVTVYGRGMDGYVYERHSEFVPDPSGASVSRGWGRSDIPDESNDWRNTGLSLPAGSRIGIAQQCCSREGDWFYRWLWRGGDDQAYLPGRLGSGAPARRWPDPTNPKTVGAPQGAAITSDISVLQEGSNTHIYAMGADGALWHNWLKADGNWGGWGSLGGILTSSPSAVFQHGLYQSVYVRGYEDRLWMRRWNGSTWGDWEQGSPPVPMATLTITKPTGGRVWSGDSSKLNCGSDSTQNKCSATYARGVTVGLSPSAYPDYRFTGWGGACAGVPSCSLKLDGDKTVSATYVRTATLSITQTTGGRIDNGISPATPGGIYCGTNGYKCSASYDLGTTSVNLYTDRQTGKVWSGACTGQGQTCTITMDGNKTVSANFDGRVTLTITQPTGGLIYDNRPSTNPDINCGTNGTKCSVSYDLEKKTRVDLVTSPQTGRVWSGACTGQGQTCTITMDGNKTVSANFDVRVTLTITQPTGGRVTSEDGQLDCGSTTVQSRCSATYANGATVLLTQSAYPEYRFTGWGGACTGTATCILRVDGDKTSSANFTLRDPVTLTITTPTGGRVTSKDGHLDCGGTSTQKQCSATYARGVTVDLSPSAYPDYRFTGWGGACTGTASTASCTLRVDGNKTVSATYVRTVTLTITRPTGGIISNNLPNEDPKMIDCGASTGHTRCSAVYDLEAKTVVTLFAWRDSGKVWSGACTGQGNPCTITMDGNKTVSATFR